MSEDTGNAYKLIQNNTGMAKFYFARGSPRHGSEEFESIKEILLHVGEGFDRHENGLVLDEEFDYSHIDIL